MKIIQHGDVKSIRFGCDNCGCVFEADRTEYKTVSHDDADWYPAARTWYSYEIKCPDCGKKCVAFDKDKE